MQPQVDEVMQSAPHLLSSSRKNRKLQILIALCGSLVGGVGKGSAGWDVSDKGHYVTQRRRLRAFTGILAVNIPRVLCRIRR